VRVGAAEVLDWSANAGERDQGCEASKLQIDWPELMHFKQSFTEHVPKRCEDEFANAVIAAFHGRARFAGPTTREVGEEKLEGRQVVIATGDAPANLEIPGSEDLKTSDQFLDLTELLRRILFIGGGYIAFEFAHLVALAESQVTVLHRRRRPLALLTQTCLISLRLETEAIGIEKSSAELIIRATHCGEKVSFQADMVVHAAGRVPEINDLILDIAGIEWDERGVRVNEFLQSVSNPAVYAAGDAAASGGPPLSPVASYEGRLVIANLLKGNHQTANYLGVPSVVFTIPPLAAVGLSERAADEQNLKFRVKMEGTSNLYPLPPHCGNPFRLQVARGRRHGPDSGRPYFGSGAAEVINLFAVAIRSGVPATELKYTLFAYPTSGSSGSPSGLALQVHSNRLDGLATGRQFYSFDETGVFGGGHPSGFAQATRLPAIRIKIRSSLSLEVPR